MRMVKGIVITFCLVFCIIQFTQGRRKEFRLGKGRLKGYCQTSDDCKKNKCCIIFETFPKLFKRNPELKMIASGKCKRLGRKNKGCLVHESNVDHVGVPGLYYHKCPCKQGLTCMKTGKMSKYGMPLKGKCKKTPTLFLKPCNHHYDCKINDECCMRRVKGKRSTSGAKAYCHPRPTLGGACHLGNKFSMLYRESLNTCPCQHRLTCIGNGKHGGPGTCRILLGAFGKK